jgi:hypothetical protein
MPISGTNGLHRDGTSDRAHKNLVLLYGGESRRAAARSVDPGLPLAPAYSPAVDMRADPARSRRPA